MMYFITEHTAPLKTGLNISKTDKAYYFKFIIRGRRYDRMWMYRRSHEKYLNSASKLVRWSLYKTKIDKKAPVPEWVKECFPERYMGRSVIPPRGN